MICLNRFIVVVGLCAAGFVALASAADTPSNIKLDPVIEQGLTVPADTEAVANEAAFSSDTPERHVAGGRNNNTDSDYDGFSDHLERQLGTDPHDAASHPTLADNHDKIAAYWPLANNAVEALEGEVNGALLNGARFKHGALELDGRRAYVNFGSSPALSFWGDFSYCLWLKPEEGHDFARILGKFQSQSDEREYALFTGHGGRIWSVLSSDGSLDWDKSIWQGTVWPVVKKNKWLHVGASWERALGAAGAQIYANGQNLWTWRWGLDGLTNLYQGSADLTLGTFDLQGAHIEDAFKGNAAQLIFCREVLTGLEMKEIYLLGRDGDLIGYINRDSDHDGLADWWERKYFGDVRQGSGTDSDGDGLTNAQEQELGTNPTLADTDGDGYSDREEVAAGSDPLDPNSAPVTAKRSLEVISAYGSTVPSVGLHEYSTGSTVTCYVVESPLTSGSTQYVGTGWTGTGSMPAGGTNLEATVILQTNSTINWRWTTNYWLGLSAADHGRVTGTSGWYHAGATVSVNAISAEEYWHFAGWSGDTAGLDTNANPVSVLMDCPRNLRANFETTLPPDPVTIAPGVRKGEASILARNISFLYSGENPIQTGVDTNAFEVKRLAVTRGKILDRAGLPLPGVTVTIFDHPEYGQTLSRADGWYDLAVNGGSAVAVDYRKDGYLPARRTIDTAWQNFSVLPEVRLIPADPVATPVQFGAGVTNAQVARASVVTDQSGTRQATVIVPSGVQALLVDDAGVTQAVNQLTMRFTEYTAGSNGPSCMPAELPSSSFYTYCVELGADEAEGKTVRFDRPVSFYVDNFLGMPVGLSVPAAYYEWKGCPGWMAEPDGIVLQILGTNVLGQAEIDLSGDGLAEDEAGLEEWGITFEERTEMAKLYAPGKSLWRVQAEHFSPWDYNYPFFVAPEGAEYPEVKIRKEGGEVKDESRRNTGGAIGIESGSFNETLSVAGTGFELNYTSRRVSGYNRLVIISATGDDVPALVKRVDIRVNLAGRQFTNSFPAQPGLEWVFQWDGKDSYGRDIMGHQEADVRIGYVYDGFYGLQLTPTYPTFATMRGLIIPGDAIRGRTEVTLWKRTEVGFDKADNRQRGLGGWMLNVHHAYDPVNQTLYYGDGKESGADTRTILSSIRTFAGTGNAEYTGDGGPARDAALNQPTDLCFAPDGTLYVADAGNNRIRKISPQGIITTIAGTGAAGYSGDGGLAINAELNNPVSVAVCAHGVVYISDNGNHVIRKVTPDGIIHTIAGTGTAGYSGDGGPAVSAQLNSPTGIAIDKECAIYIADTGNYRVRRIGPDQRINTTAGTGMEEYYGAGDGGPALAAGFWTPTDVAVAEDGSVLVADWWDERIRRIGNDGIINTVYQSSWPGLYGCRAVTTRPGSSSFYVMEYMFMIGSPSMVWEVNPDGTSRRVAGAFFESFPGPLGDGGPATAAYLDDAEGACFGPDGTLYIADTMQHRIRSVKVDYPGFSNEEIVIASEDGSEIYVFDAAGRHLRTLNADTQALIYEFAYTPEGVLASITDGNGLITTIERDSSGNPTAIVGPYGHRTEMKLDANGWLTELANPAGERNLMSYTTNGLLTNVVSRRGYEFHQEYDSEGKIINNTDPAGGGNSLTHQELENGWSVAIADGLGRTNTHIVERLSDGTETRRIIDPAGLQVVKTETPEGNVVLNHPDGTQIIMQQGPDPRFGMQSPIVKHQEISTPSHFNVTDFERIAGLTNKYDPFSITNMIEYLTVNGRTWASQYTTADRQTVSYTPMGRQSVVRTDALGRPVYLQSSGVSAVSNEYDAAGRLVKTAQGEGAGTRVVQLQYAADGTLRSVNNTLGEQVLMFADRIGRLTNQVFADANTLNLAYDRSSAPVKYLLPHGTEHQYGYNPVGLTERYSSPSVDSVPTNTFWRYNAARQMDYLVKPDGTVISNVYDSAGRLVATRAEKDGAVDEIDYTYDSAGRVGSASRSGNAIQYSYDAFLLTDEQTPAGTVTRGYDDDFRVTSLTLNGSMGVSYAYDDDGLLIQAGDISLARDPTTGFLTGTTLGNITDQRTHNGFGEVSQYTANVSGNPVYTVAYNYDALGRITNQAETIDSNTANKSYVYDNRGRLTQVMTNGSLSESYTYDANGNALTRYASRFTNDATYDSQDRMLSYDDLSFGYSLNGEQTNRTIGGQTTSLAYDLFGQLASVALPDGRIISYDKDALGRITAKRVNGAIVKGWIYKDGLKPIAETDASGNIISVFIYGSSPFTPDYMMKNGNTYRLIRDHVGSVRLVVDTATGTVAQRIDYDSFGNVLSDTAHGFQPFGFQSGLYDNDTGFVQFGARWYDPLTGRWLSKDSLLLAAGWNVYVFCNNNPVALIDPLGLDVIYLLDSNVVLGQGHAAAIVGSDRIGWTYYSFGLGTRLRTSDNYDVRNYRTLQEARADNSRYDQSIYYRTSEDATRVARREGNSRFGESYWLAGRNCDDVASDIIRAAGVNFRDAWRPVQSYRQNRQNDESNISPK